MSNACAACGHPARDVIDQFYRNGNRFLFDTGETVTTAVELIAVLKEKYPDDKLTKDGLSLHKTRHVLPSGVKYMFDGAGNIKVPGMGIIEHISPIESQKIIITLGTRYLMEHPEKINAGHVVDAVGNLARIGGAIKEESEIKKAWADKLKKMAKQKVKGVDGNVTEVDFSDEVVNE